MTNLAWPFILVAMGVCVATACNESAPNPNAASIEAKVADDAVSTNRKKADDSAKLEAQKQAELEAQKQAELEAQKQAELEAQRQAKLEAQRQAELEAQRQAELEAQRQAKLEAQRQAELEAQRQAELEAQWQNDLRELEAEMIDAYEDTARNWNVYPGYSGWGGGSPGYPQRTREYVVHKRCYLCSGSGACLCTLKFGNILTDEQPDYTASCDSCGGTGECRVCDGSGWYDEIETR